MYNRFHKTDDQDHEDEWLSDVLIDTRGSLTDWKKIPKRIIFNGQIKTHPERLDIPLKRRKPTVYAVWNDLFHESVPDEFIANAWHTMGNFNNLKGEMVPVDKRVNHTYLVLTKRPQRMLAFLSSRYPKGYERKSVYCGLTVCNQQEADEKIPIFLQVPGKKFLSIEPCLSEIKLQFAGCPNCGQSKQYWFPNYIICGGCGKEVQFPPEHISAVILGGETGPGARPMHPEWVRSIVQQCNAAGVPVFVKQIHVNGKPSKDMNEWPGELRVRELPWLGVANH